ncbi:hypothetical protein, partial [Avibacterium avium]|uniref:hypothetical protein n=1 Tax=Avibacterium avium TaxID=751 RepID=UPI003BF8D59D
NELDKIDNEKILLDIDIARLFDSIQDKVRNRLYRQRFWQLDGEKFFIITLSDFETLYCGDITY